MGSNRLHLERLQLPAHQCGGSRDGAREPGQSVWLAGMQAAASQEEQTVSAYNNRRVGEGMVDEEGGGVAGGPPEV